MTRQVSGAGGPVSAGWVAPSRWLPTVSGASLSPDGSGERVRSEAVSRDMSVSPTSEQDIKSKHAATSVPRTSGLILRRRAHMTPGPLRAHARLLTTEAARAAHPCPQRAESLGGLLTSMEPRIPARHPTLRHSAARAGSEATRLVSCNCWLGGLAIRGLAHLLGRRIKLISALRSERGL